MITDKFGQEFRYLDYVVYLRDDEPVLAKVMRIVISKSVRIIVASRFGTEPHRWTENRALKNFDNIEIVTEEWAKENYFEDYKRLKYRIE